MANTTTLKRQTLEVTGLDADWDATSDYDMGAILGYLFLRKITFVPSSANDLMIITDGEGGPEIFRHRAQNLSDMKTEWFDDIRCAPFIDISACSLATAANARVDMQIA